MCTQREIVQCSHLSSVRISGALALRFVLGPTTVTLRLMMDFGLSSFWMSLWDSIDNQIRKYSCFLLSLPVLRSDNDISMFFFKCYWEARICRMNPYENTLVQMQICVVLGHIRCYFVCLECFCSKCMHSWANGSGNTPPRYTVALYQLSNCSLRKCGRSSNI